MKYFYPFLCFCPRQTLRKPPIEGFYIEMNLRKQKWLISCSCNPNKFMIGQHVEALSKSMDLHS